MTEHVLATSEQIICHSDIHKDIAKRARKSEREQLLKELRFGGHDDAAGYIEAVLRAAEIERETS